MEQLIILIRDFIAVETILYYNFFLIHLNQSPNTCVSMIPGAFFDVASNIGEICFITKCGSIGVVHVLVRIIFLGERAARFVNNTISTIYVAIVPI